MVDELKNVVKRKFPKKEQTIEKLLMMMSYEFPFTLTSNNDVLSPFHIKKSKSNALFCLRYPTT